MKRLAASGYFLIIMSAFGFSFKGILAKLAYSYGVDAMTLMLMRMTIALPFFLLALVVIDGKDALKVSAKELALYAFMGIAGIGLAMLFSLYALELIDATIATIVVFTYPAMTVVLLALFNGQRLTERRFLPIAVTFAGLLLVVGMDKAVLASLNLKGVAFGLLSAFCYAVYNALSERALKDRSAIRLITYCIVFQVAFFGGLFGWREYPRTADVWAIAALQGILSGFMPFVFFTYGVKKIGVGRAVVIGSLGPVFTAVWAYFFLNERLMALQVLGMFMVVSGIVLLKLKREATEAKADVYAE